MTEQHFTLQALAMDLDGTLLNSQKEISETNLQALQNAHDKGVEIIIATGRMSPTVYPKVAQFPFPCSIVSYNGARLLEQQNGSWNPLIAETLDTEVVKDVYRLCQEKKLFLNVYRDDVLYGYHPDGDYEWAGFYSKATSSVFADYYNNLEPLPVDNITKLLSICSYEIREAHFPGFEDFFQGRCTVVKSEPEYTEFIPTGVSKATALEKWCKLKNIPVANLVTMGDAENDLEMLRFAGKGIASANCTPGVKAVFDNVSEWTNDEHMVAKELERLL
ncbi:MAG: HAD family phosphatase [Fibrobacteria bacterium]|nr:HAD family phosphatase [Fibrobacteria bacterium]